MNRREYWVNDLFLERNQEGFYKKLIPLLLKNDNYSIKKFLRVDSQILNYLFEKLNPALSKKIIVREPISPEERIIVTLRFLATGESYASLCFGFRIAPNTISLIVPETCKAIINILGQLHLKTPNLTSEWVSICNQFQLKWQFPGCLGAIDGKHIAIKKPPHSGSSIVLLAVVDANYRFIRCEVGTNGQISDGGVWNHSEFRNSVEQNKLNIPTYFNNFKTVFISDDAFPLKDYLMKPFRSRNLRRENLIFNYRLSRARNVVENAFGILASRFRCLLTTLNLDVQNVKLVVLSCCIMHNILIENLPGDLFNLADQENSRGEVTPGQWRRGQVLESLTNSRSNNQSIISNTIRNSLVEYFNGDGRIAQQDYLFRNVN